MITGLVASPKWLPTKFLYDELGSQLFDQICDLPEYYLTRTEEGLLENISQQIADITKATHLVELGSGSGRKTRLIIEALAQRLGKNKFGYVPVDISESALIDSAMKLIGSHPQLVIDGKVFDYSSNFPDMNLKGTSLAIFLGSTIGNFNQQEAVDFLTRLHCALNPDDWFLLGTDLRKEKSVMEAAYNDSQGITAAFNKNILTVVNRELAADFQLDAFTHWAPFNEELSQIEMHLISNKEQAVHLENQDTTINFAEGESILTEISRKFTREVVEDMLHRAGFSLRHWFVSNDDSFALSLAQAEGR